MGSQALKLLQNSKSTVERAQSYVDTVAKNIQKDILDIIQDEITKKEDKLFDLENFNLDTDKNAGVQAVTREEVESRFKEIIQIRYDLTLLQAELKVKQDTFTQLFKDVPESRNEGNATSQA